MDAERELVRHLAATVAYRGGKAIRDAPASFAAFAAGDAVRTPVQILAHIGDLYDWALSIMRGQEAWHDSAPLSWDEEAARFFATLQRFDDYLASGQPIASTLPRLLQGPIADSLAHIGQLTLLRRLSGARIRSENYSKADIRAGRVGAEQTPPRREFD